MPENQTLVHRRTDTRTNPAACSEGKRELGRAVKPTAGWAPAWYALLNLAFFVDNVLASDRIEFLDLELVLANTFVLGCRVKMSSSGTGDESNFFAYGHLATTFYQSVFALYLHATGTQLG